MNKQPWVAGVHKVLASKSWMDCPVLSCQVKRGATPSPWIAMAPGTPFHVQVRCKPLQVSLLESLPSTADHLKVMRQKQSSQKALPPANMYTAITISTRRTAFGMGRPGAQKSRGRCGKFPMFTALLLLDCHGVAGFLHAVPTKLRNACLYETLSSPSSSSGSIKSFVWPANIVMIFSSLVSKGTTLPSASCLSSN